MKYLLIGMLTFIALEAVAEEKFQLGPYVSADGREVAFGVQVKLKVGGLIPSWTELKNLWFGDEVPVESMVSQVENDEKLHRENKELIEHEVKPVNLPKDFDSRPWYKRPDRWAWIGASLAGTLLVTEATDVTDVFGRSDSGSNNNEQDVTVIPNGTSISLQNSTGNNIFVNSPNQSRQER